MPFDVKKLCQLLRIASQKATRTLPLFKFGQIEGMQPNKHLPVVGIITEYSLAQEVIDALAMCVAEDGLVLFDAEMNFLNAISEITCQERQRIVTLRLAQLRYNRILRQELNSSEKKSHVFIYKLGDCLDMFDDGFYSSVSDTSIALMKGNLSNVAKQLHSLLSQEACLHNEEVYCKDGCFIVKNKTAGYRLRFVLEGTGKSPMNLCWLENGEIKIELLHRMGVYQTRKSIVKLAGWAHIREEEEYIRSRLYFSEVFFTRGNWQNPADKFVDSYKISSKLKKSSLNIIYGQHPGKPHHEYSFSENSDDTQGYIEGTRASGFSIAEGEAVPLLALVESVIPYDYHYYHDSFHVRQEEARELLLRLKEVRAIVSRNPSDVTLGKIKERLTESSFARRESSEDINANTTACLYSNRCQLVALYDFFEWWLKNICDNNNGFHITGP